MTLVRLGAPQLGHVILNVGDIKGCAQRLIEQTKRLVLAAPHRRLGHHRWSDAMSICGGTFG